MEATGRRWSCPALLGFCIPTAAIIGFLVGGSGAGLLCGCAGFIFGWALCKGALVAGIRGAVLGVTFAILVGPVADHLVNRVPITEKLKPAMIVGSLVGGLLGVRNFRRPKPVA